MNIIGAIEFPDPESRKSTGRILQAISPDNLLNMKSEISDEKIVVQFYSKKIGSLLATVDDFLLNVKIGEELEKTLKKETNLGT
jgi:hypothetical protein